VSFQKGFYFLHLTQQLLENILLCLPPQKVINRLFQYMSDAR